MCGKEGKKKFKDYLCGYFERDVEYLGISYVNLRSANLHNFVKFPVPFIKKKG